jgi:hypothetical protein
MRSLYLLAPALFASIGCCTHSAHTYQSHFGQAGPEWSFRQTQQSPKDGRSFLGPGLNDPITLSLHNLPSHHYVRITFDLLILDSWDGSGRLTLDKDVVGPDCFRLAFTNGRVLFWHTFSTTPNQPGFSPETMVQTYPSPVAGDKCPANAGAAAINTLGFIRDYGGDAQFPMDAVYHISMIVPHTGQNLGLEFKGFGLQPISHWTDYRMDEGWGLDHVKVEPLSQSDVKICSLEEARTLLATASSPGDPAKANTAYLSLLTGGPAVRQACHEALRDAGCDDQAMRQLATQADSPNPATSAPALKHLDELGGLAEHTLWDLSSPSHPPQIRASAIDMLKELHSPGTDSTRRKAAVASRVTEAIGSHE